ncbi:MAG: hypothetical protein RLZ88_545 [Actinomycetota bacterium]|jgi:hypothetical protein
MGLNQSEVNVALSERERKLLEELERGLYESDSSFAAKMGGSQAKLAAGRASSPKRIVGGAALVLIGLSVILAALIMKYPAFAVVGFGFMVFGLSLATGQFGRLAKKARGLDAGKRNVRAKAKNSATGLGGIQAKFEERWDRREGQ